MKSCASRLRTIFPVSGMVLLAGGVLALYAATAGEGETPKSPGGTVSLPRAPLLKENSRLIDVEGLVLDMKDDLKTSPVHRWVFQPRDGLGYFTLLENTLLEKTLAETAHGERPVRVRGTITLCRGKNYLLLDWAAVKRE